MNSHKQLLTFLIAILVLGGGSLTIIFAEINQSEEVFLEHVQKPAHGVASEKLTNIENDVSELKDDFKEFQEEIRAWYQENAN